ncbi:GIY-YIG nuclease family protein [Gemmata sp. G18]|uniref:GIY-YIG nuclease family protein n=1 Tax=Gemmata palustris TaxID=2822762 RepID=A0ABS5BYL3_9BACT|nr:GIY-YIG nuclease family protein [Gemmata palustris]MBP3957973.1 GIY-YIG nuclease family protein [Gemmata palustris]
MKTKIPGIYTITCQVTGEVYVGQSINLISRRAAHFRELLKGTHPNKRLQADFSKYGSQAFVWRSIPTASVELLCQWETHYIKVLGASYNQSDPPKRIRRDGDRFNPFLQELRRAIRSRQRRRAIHEQRDNHPVTIPRRLGDTSTVTGEN